MLMALVRILLGGFFSGVYKRSKAVSTTRFTRNQPQTQQALIE